VGDHGGENGVDKNQAPTNGEEATSPPGEAFVALGDDGGKIGEAKFMG
jgi:hypothetical protein